LKGKNPIMKKDENCQAAEREERRKRNVRFSGKKKGGGRSMGEKWGGRKGGVSSG